MQLGIDRLLADPALLRRLKGRRVGLVAHPASVTARLEHSLDALVAAGVNVTCAFGPQHGLRGDVQDNMVETPHERDAVHGIPAWSLYSETRRPTDEMLDGFDVALFDLQDIGTRVYTYMATLLYMMEGCARRGRELWVLDRPNPIGRPVEGTRLETGWESFVGVAHIPMRHGLTLGELARYFRATRELDLACEVVAMRDWRPDEAPGFGWPVAELAWVNPSPNAATLSMARAFPGTVLLEGTTLSEGRGTTHPLEVFGHPELDGRRWIETMRDIEPAWLEGCALRPCAFLPMFQKHAGRACHGFQVHVDEPHHDAARFRPYRLAILALRAARAMKPDLGIWRDFHYEYEKERLAFDLITGSSLAREWVDDVTRPPADLDARCAADEAAWTAEREGHLLYPAVAPGARS